MRSEILDAGGGGLRRGRKLRTVYTMMSFPSLKEIEVPEHKDLGAKGGGLGGRAVGVNPIPKPLMLLWEQAKVVDTIHNC